MTTSAAHQGMDIGRWITIPRTLIFLYNGGDVLLMRRSPTTPIFPGHYNGIGGHIERNEDPYAGALHEITEESGLTPSQISALRLRGIVQVDGGGAAGVIMFIFSGEALARAVQDTAEGALAWVSPQSVSSLPCVEDIPIYLERIASGGDLPFFAHLSYDAQDRMILRFAEIR